MSLLAAQALLTNAAVQARVESAIRATAAERLGWDGPAGTLAQAGFSRPDTIATHFLLRLATNGDVVAAACSACGHAGDVPDDTIEWIVGDSWHDIGTELYGSPEADPTD